MQSIIFINFIIFYERVILNNPMSLMQKYSSIFKIVPDHSVTNLSTSFKNSGRSDMHPFKARYSTPMHDLDYTKPILQHSPSKSPGKSGSKQKKLVKNPEAVTEFRIKSVKKADTNTALANNNNGVQLSNYQMKQNNKQTILIESREDEILKKMQRTASSINKSSPLFKTISKFRQSTFGLSDCEFSNTIIGKVSKKSAHHLDFQKMPDRQQNINKVWYSKEESFSPVDRERNRNKILANKIHFFKSDSSHKAFDVGNPFDKFYDTPYNLVKKRSDVVIRSLDKVKSRAGLEIKLGTNLDYQKDRSLQNKKRPIFEIAQTERKLKISRQVISPQKGVYR